MDYGIDRADLALMGGVTGVGVGVMQALVLARHRIPGAFWWVVANALACALGWIVSSFVISRNIEERFQIFGASGALVFGLLTWLLLAARSDQWPTKSRGRQLPRHPHRPGVLDPLHAT